MWSLEPRMQKKRIRWVWFTLALSVDVTRNVLLQLLHVRSYCCMWLLSYGKYRLGRGLHVICTLMPAFRSMILLLLGTKVGHFIDSNYSYTWLLWFTDSAIDRSAHAYNYCGSHAHYLHVASYIYTRTVASGLHSVLLLFVSRGCCN